MKFWWKVAILATLNFLTITLIGVLYVNFADNVDKTVSILD